MNLLTERLQRELASLPVAAIAEPLNETLQKTSAAIVTAAPGAGKSTVLPLMLLQRLPEGTGKIVVLEPRRVAARQIASRMAWLLQESVGETVGYRIRFESRVSPQTRIEVVTEGVLTRMLLDDPALEEVAVVVFDEFHERSLNTDEAFALVRQCRELLRTLGRGSQQRKRFCSHKVPSIAAARSGFPAYRAGCVPSRFVEAVPCYCHL